ncbi:MAG: alpha/beta fold hydrolase [Gammaproteobacteria bacterium]|nr:alpha/beta fold hydrolase [Gammaproteobacteria bacterium]
MGHKPFAVIADYLTNRGFAVLRMDDRGVGKSEGSFKDAIPQNFANDINSAVNYLKQRKDIPSDTIGLVGHSEGGMIAPMVASKRDDIAFVVLLAAPGIYIDELYAEQRYLIMRASGLNDEWLKEMYESEKKVFAEIRKLPVEQDIPESLINDLKAAHSALELNDNSTDQLIEFMSSPWFRHFFKYDPEHYLKDLNAPVLALNGTLDLQVAAESNLAGLRSIFEKHQHKDYTIKALEQLNHLFQTAKTGNVTEYHSIEQTFAPVALESMVSWLDKRFK